MFHTLILLSPCSLCYIICQFFNELVSHTYRSKQLFGPCPFSSAYQHALVPVINIGECRVSTSFIGWFSRPGISVY